MYIHLHLSQVANISNEKKFILIYIFLTRLMHKNTPWFKFIYMRSLAVKITNLTPIAE